MIRNCSSFPVLDEQYFRFCIMSPEMNDKLISAADGYVFLTKQMNDEVNVAKKPYLVLEGHVNEDMKEKTHKPFLENEKRVIYAGAIEKIYGIEMLCKAFLDIALPGENLHIYGNGDYAEELLALAKENENIVYHGNRPNDEVVEAELNATLLVNPRPTDGEYTKFSFPSKTLEYMVSGTPVLTTKLPGIPDEYYDYCFTADDFSAENIGKNITEIFAMPEDELKAFGAKARQFALKNKNSYVQSERILEFIKKEC